MKVYVVGSSALYYWRRCPNGKRLLKNKVLEPLADCPCTLDDLRAADLANYDFGSSPVRLMVPNAELRVARHKYRYTVQSRPLPELAFRKIGNNICIASPELCLLESTGAYSECQLIELCMEVCGRYALASEQTRGYISRNFQLATKQSIKSFIRLLSSAQGIKRLANAIRYVQEGSRSPMESREYLLMCLPKRMGGYGLPLPSLNLRLDLTSDEQAVAKRKYFECDMCWPEHGVVVEYDGHDDHESREDRARDAVRRNILIARGYEVFTITGGQICDAKIFDAQVRDIARAIGYRLRDFPNEWVERRCALRSELFASMSGCGRMGLCK